jgi:hypothetical protein
MEPATILQRLEELAGRHIATESSNITLPGRAARRAWITGELSPRREPKTIIRHRYKIDEATRWLTDAHVALEDAFPQDHAVLKQWASVTTPITGNPQKASNIALLEAVRAVVISARDRVKAGYPSLEKATSAQLTRFSGQEVFQALSDFLVSAFAADELRRLVHGLSNGARLEAALPGASASLSHLAFEGVRVLVRHGLIGAALFDRLEAERPHRLDEIRRIRQRFEDATDTGPHRFSPAPASPSGSERR